MHAPTNAAIMSATCGSATRMAMAQHGQRTDGTDADGQSVQPVDQIHGIGEPYNPNYGDGNGKPPKIPVRIVTEQIGIGDTGDLHTVINRNQRRQNLHYELEAGPQRRDIVDDSHHHNDHAAEQDALHLVVDLYNSAH